MKTSLFLIALTSGITGYATPAAGNAVTSDGTVFSLLIAFIVVLLFIIIVLAGAIRNIASNKSVWMKKSSGTLPAVLLIAAGLLLPENAMAAGSGNGGFVLNNTTYYLLLATIVFLFLVAMFLASTLKALLNELNDVKTEVSFIDKITADLTEAVPVENEAEVMTDHEYDGIRELDNVLPPWWVYLFYATIIFSFIYLFRYHIFSNGKVMENEYQAEMMEAERQKELLAAASPGTMIDENNVTRLTEAADLERAGVIFESKCASCHRADGGGDIGPNLTDQYWIHGGSIQHIFTTIKYGVPNKMIPWQTQLNPEDLQRVASYVMSIQGTNPVDPKAPEGELFMTEDVEIPTDTTTAEKDSVVAI